MKWLGRFLLNFEFFNPSEHTWKAKCPICMAIVAGFRGKVALKK